MDDRTAAKTALQFETLTEAALKEAGATSFRDTSFLPNLKHVLEIPTRLEMSVAGLQGLGANFQRLLVNRLRYEADDALHPEILDEDVSDPIVVLGLPRSGTTKLQRVLSADPQVQATPMWSMVNPAPLPGEQPGDPTPRKEWADRMLGIVAHTGESYRVMHEFKSDEAEESSFVPIANFDYVMQFISLPDYQFLEWARSISRVPPLTYLRQMLQYLQWQQGGKRGPWVLKNPGHTGEVAEMLEVFPNATFVISQRDLADTMGSSMRMMTEILRTAFDDFDRNRMADDTISYWSYELDRYQAQRQALGSRIRIVETPYQRCVRDAISIAREVWSLHGLPWTEEGEQAMRDWEQQNPRHKHGGYDYALEDFGWSEEKVLGAFGDIGQLWRGQ